MSFPALRVPEAGVIMPLQYLREWQSSLHLRRGNSLLSCQGVGSPRFYFPGCENPRHSRGLGWRASVSDRRFLEFRSLRGGFRAPVSGRHFPISISVGQRPVRLQTETGSQSALGGLVGADATAINERTFVFRRMHRRGQRRQHLSLGAS